jgi:hypothetical protein
MQSQATLATANAKRYLGQFTKHFAHKLPTDLAEDLSTGSVTFGAGSCRLAATPDLLTLTLDGPDADIANLQDVVDRHLVRFAFREDISLAWTPISG